MSSLLFGVSVAAALSMTSLLTVLLRVSPLTSPGPAITAFLLSLALTVSSCGTLAFYVLWRMLPVHAWDAGKLLTIALRQGIFLGLATVSLMSFHLLGLLTWWIGILIYVLFLLIELALEH
jgi:hypothetical protein